MTNSFYMHPKYQEFLAFMADCPHRKTPGTMETAFWVWLKIEESLALPFLANAKSTAQTNIFKQGDLVRKRPGDEVEVKRAGRVVTLEGEVHRPGTYQLIGVEGVNELISYYGDGLGVSAKSDKG